LRQRRAELGAEPVLVTFAPLSRARAHIEERRLDWTVLVDEERTLYRAYGMDRAPWWQIWTLATLRAYAREMRGGVWPRRAREDVRQRGGDVLVDPEGFVRLHHVGKDPADRPSVDSIIEAVRRAPRERPPAAI
jgi:hypothetical protein